MVEKEKYLELLKQSLTKKMNAREFYYLVKQMRETQRDYFRNRDQKTLRAARALEGDVDREIKRVEAILAAREDQERAS